MNHLNMKWINPESLKNLVNLTWITLTWSEPNLNHLNMEWISHFFYMERIKHESFEYKVNQCWINWIWSGYDLNNLNVMIVRPKFLEHEVNYIWINRILIRSETIEQWFRSESLECDLILTSIIYTSKRHILALAYRNHEI